MNRAAAPVLFLTLLGGTSCTMASGNRAAGAGAGAGGSEAGEPPDASSVPETGHVLEDADAVVADAGFQSLFSDHDWSGWDRYLGKPSDADPPLGLNDDPIGVYSMVTKDGEPAIRISGKVWGSLISKDEFCNFHLRAEYEWGAAIWPPLNARDSGLMFLSTGPLGAVNAGGSALSSPIGSGAFMVATEYQIAPGDVGGMYNLGPVAFTTSFHVGSIELPDSWNQIELTVQDDQVTHRLNGQDVTRASAFRLDWPGEPESVLRCGKLQLQSEGAEIFFRRVEIEVLP